MNHFGKDGVNVVQLVFGEKPKCWNNKSRGFFFFFLRRIWISVWSLFVELSIILLLRFLLPPLIEGRSFRWVMDTWNALITTCALTNEQSFCIRIIYLYYIWPQSFYIHVWRDLQKLNLCRWTASELYIWLDRL